LLNILRLYLESPLAENNIVLQNQNQQLVTAKTLFILAAAIFQVGTSNFKATIVFPNF
jgi:hypothetical protein